VTVADLLLEARENRPPPPATRAALRERIAALETICTQLVWKSSDLRDAVFALRTAVGDDDEPEPIAAPADEGSAISGNPT